MKKHLLIVVHPLFSPAAIFESRLPETMDRIDVVLSQDAEAAAQGNHFAEEYLIKLAKLFSLYQREIQAAIKRGTCIALIMDFEERPEELIETMQRVYSEDDISVSVLQSLAAYARAAQQRLLDWCQTQTDDLFASECAPEVLGAWLLETAPDLARDPSRHSLRVIGETRGLCTKDAVKSLIRAGFSRSRRDRACCF